MKKMTIDGNEACSNSAYLFTEIAGIYPITPSSPMAEHLEEWSQTRLNIFGNHVNVIQMQSEAGAAGFVHGSLRSGLLTSTFTASQGLLLMIPNMYKIAGEMLPLVMHVAARSLSTHALSIFGDHQDIYAARSTGFAMLASSSVQDAAYLGAVAHLAAIKSSLPFMHFFDGFRTSHEIQKINVLEQKDVENLIDLNALNNIRQKGINPLNPKTYGTNQNDDIYFQATEVRNQFYDKLPDIVNEYMQEINKITNSDYQPFNYYGKKDATKVIVAMGSVCETIKEVIDNSEEKIGLIEVHLYRPFSSKYLLNIIPKSTEKIAVIDRTKEPGSIGEPLYLDVVASLKDLNIKICGGRYGLSSKDTTPSQIKAIYNMLDNPVSDFTIGIDDDVTNLSLKTDDFYLKNSKEMLFYGYGSDGMVSASKSLIKLIGDNTDNYVQGYFQYDSKKSGGLTTTHLRVSDNLIKSTYYVNQPDIVVVTKDSYLNEISVLDNISANGIFILNTMSENIEQIPENIKFIIKQKNIKFYIINAYALARKVGLGNKISTIMQMAIIKTLDLIDYDFAVEEVKKDIKNRFFTKSEQLVQANFEAIDLVPTYLKEIKLDGEYQKQPLQYNGMLEAMQMHKGNELPVSTFLTNPDGTFEAGTTKLEKRTISDIVPHWIKENCIKCNMCSLVCPHSVIRPVLIEEEVDKEIKATCLDDFNLTISVKDCTGCTLCVKTCPAKNKALVMNKLDEELKSQDIYNYLETVKTKETTLNTIKDICFRKPKIEFPGACSGCGQPAYIRLLSQILGDSLIIANATGCSSIYGASAPFMPYTVPWASSLFEDNAEYGYGMVVANQVKKNEITKVMENIEEEFAKTWLANTNEYEITKKIYESIDYNKYPQLESLKEFIPTRNIWTIGGDGWAYDIGFSGIDHVLASNDNAKILVLDTQVYSNTGGQSSKASSTGSIATFTTSGKKTGKKDLARIALAYPNAYVAQISLAANPMQAITAFKEASLHNGPAIIIAYAPCIAHGISGGMSNSLEMEKEAVMCGYFPIFRYNPDKQKFSLDSKANFDLYEQFLSKQTMYSVLPKINDHATDLLNENKNQAINRYKYYETLIK